MDGQGRSAPERVWHQASPVLGNWLNGDAPLIPSWFFRFPASSGFFSGDKSPRQKIIGESPFLPRGQVPCLVLGPDPQVSKSPYPYNLLGVFREILPHSRPCGRDLGPSLAYRAWAPVSLPMLV